MSLRETVEETPTLELDDPNKSSSLNFGIILCLLITIIVLLIVILVSTFRKTPPPPPVIVQTPPPPPPQIIQQPIQQQNSQPEHDTDRVIVKSNPHLDRKEMMNKDIESSTIQQVEEKTTPDEQPLGYFVFENSAPN